MNMNKKIIGRLFLSFLMVITAMEPMRAQKKRPMKESIFLLSKRKKEIDAMSRKSVCSVFEELKQRRIRLLAAIEKVGASGFPTFTRDRLSRLNAELEKACCTLAKISFGFEEYIKKVITFAISLHQFLLHEEVLDIESVDSDCGSGCASAATTDDSDRVPDELGPDASLPKPDELGPDASFPESLAELKDSIEKGLSAHLDLDNTHKMIAEFQSEQEKEDTLEDKLEAKKDSLYSLSEFLATLLRDDVYRSVLPKAEANRLFAEYTQELSASSKALMLCCAAEAGLFNLAKKILECYPEVMDEVLPQARTFMHYAFHSLNFKMAQLFLPYGVSVFKFDKNGQMPFEFVCKERVEDLIKYYCSPESERFVRRTYSTLFEGRGRWEGQAYASAGSTAATARPPRKRQRCKVDSVAKPGWLNGFVVVETGSARQNSYSCDPHGWRGDDAAEIAASVGIVSAEIAAAAAFDRSLKSAATNAQGRKKLDKVIRSQLKRGWPGPAPATLTAFIDNFFKNITEKFSKDDADTLLDAYFALGGTEREVVKSIYKKLCSEGYPVYYYLFKRGITLESFDNSSS